MDRCKNNLVSHVSRFGTGITFAHSWPTAEVYVTPLRKKGHLTCRDRLPLEEGVRSGLGNILELVRSGQFLLSQSDTIPCSVVKSAGYTLYRRPSFLVLAVHYSELKKSAALIFRMLNAGK